MTWHFTQTLTDVQKAQERVNSEKAEALAAIATF